ncbi:MAG: hypothetical protein RR311_10805 [Comamonas sp.]
MFEAFMAVSIMKLKTVFFSALIFLLSACSTAQAPTSSQNYNQENSAKVRLYGLNQKPSIMTVQTGHGANGRVVKYSVGGNIADAFDHFICVGKNESVGIAETENTRNIKSGDGILSKAFYREFVIPAGRPVEVENAFVGLTALPFAGKGVVQSQGSCSSAKVRFTPEAGRDYEVCTYRSGNSCTVMVFEIQTLAGAATLVPIQEN